MAEANSGGASRGGRGGGGRGRGGSGRGRFGGGAPRGPGVADLEEPGCPSMVFAPPPPHSSAAISLNPGVAAFSPSWSAPSTASSRTGLSAESPAFVPTGAFVAAAFPPSAPQQQQQQQQPHVQVDHPGVLVRRMGDGAAEDAPRAGRKQGEPKKKDAPAREQPPKKKEPQQPKKNRGGPPSKQSDASLLPESGAAVAGASAASSAGAVGDAGAAHALAAVPPARAAVPDPEVHRHQRGGGRQNSNSKKKEPQQGAGRAADAVDFDDDDGGGGGGGAVGGRKVDGGAAAGDKGAAHESAKRRARDGAVDKKKEPRGGRAGGGRRGGAASVADAASVIPVALVGPTAAEIEDARQADEERRQAAIRAEEERREAARRAEEERRRAEQERVEAERRAEDERRNELWNKTVGEAREWVAEQVRKREADEKQASLNREVALQIPRDQPRVALDSNVKKTAAFVKKLRAVSDFQGDVLLGEMEKLNLSRYTTEVAPALCESKISRPTDVDKVVTLATLMHQRYDDFAPLLLKGLLEPLSVPHLHRDRRKRPWVTADERTAADKQQAEEAAASASRKRVVFRLLSELHCAGVVSAADALSGALRGLLDSDAQEDATHTNLQLVTSVMRYAGQRLLGIPRRSTLRHLVVAAHGELVDAGVETRDEVLARLGHLDPADCVPPVGPLGDDVRGQLDDHVARLRGQVLPTPALPDAVASALRRDFVSTYFEKIGSRRGSVFLRLHQSERQNRKQQLMNGEVSAENVARAEFIRQSYDAIERAIEPLADLLNVDVPELPPVPEDEDDVELVFESAPGAAAADGGLFEDAATRLFYESYPHLEVIVPAILLGKAGRALAAANSASAQQEQQADKTGGPGSGGVGAGAGGGDVAAAAATAPSGVTDTEAAAEEAALNVSDVEQLEKLAHVDPNAGADEAPSAVSAEPGGVSGETAESRSIDVFLGELSLALSVAEVDRLAEKFCMLQNKGSRRRLVEFVYDLPARQAFMAPYLCRLVATLARVLDDVGSEVVRKFESEFYRLLKRSDPMGSLKDVRLRNATFLAELVKFGVAPPVVAFRCWQACLLNITVPSSVSVMGALLRGCGRWLFRNPVTHSMCEKFLQRMVDAKSARLYDRNQIAAVDNAYYCCNPPVVSAMAQRPPLHPLLQYIRRLIFVDLEADNVLEIRKKLRKLPWDMSPAPVLASASAPVSSPPVAVTVPAAPASAAPAPAGAPSGADAPATATTDPDGRACAVFVMRCLGDVSQVRFSHLGHMAALVAELAKVRPVVPALVDSLLEDVRRGFEQPISTDQQRRLTVIRYVCELFLAGVVHVDSLFACLYLAVIIGAGSELDPPSDSYRLRWVCTVLSDQVVARLHRTPAAKTRLEAFLAHFQLYFLSKEMVPFDAELMVTHMFERAAPALARASTLAEAAEAVRLSDEAARKANEALDVLYTQAEVEAAQKLLREQAAAAARGQLVTISESDGAASAAAAAEDDGDVAENDSGDGAGDGDDRGGEEAEGDEEEDEEEDDDEEEEEEDDDEGEDEGEEATEVDGGGDDDGDGDEEGDDEGDSDEGDSEDESEEEEEEEEDDVEMFERGVAEGSRRQAEDAEFQIELQRMLAESMESRKLETIRGNNLTAPSSFLLGAGAAAGSSGGGLPQVAEGNVVFQFLTRGAKSGPSRALSRPLNVPVQSDLGARMVVSAEQQRAERAELKRLTLQGMAREEMLEQQRYRQGGAPGAGAGAGVGGAAGWGSGPRRRDAEPAEISVNAPRPYVARAGGAPGPPRSQKRGREEKTRGYIRRDLPQQGFDD